MEWLVGTESGVPECISGIDQIEIEISTKQ